METYPRYFQNLQSGYIRKYTSAQEGVWLSGQFKGNKIVGIGGALASKANGILREIPKHMVEEILTPAASI